MYYNQNEHYLLVKAIDTSETSRLRYYEYYSDSLITIIALVLMYLSYIIGRVPQHCANTIRINNNPYKDLISPSNWFVAPATINDIDISAIHRYHTDQLKSRW